MRRVGAAVLPVCLCACAVAAHASGVEVLSISPTPHDATASTQWMPQCDAWRLTKAQARTFFTIAEKIDGFEFHERYDHARCRVTGAVRVDGVVWQYDINAAAKATLRNKAGTKVMHMGCDKPASRCSC